MKNKSAKKRKHIQIAIAVCVLGLLACTKKLYAAPKTTDLSGEFYEFSEKSKYEISSSEKKNTTDNSDVLGALSVSGNFKEINDIDSTPAFDVSEGDLELKYAFDKSILEGKDEEWHLTDDGSKEIDGVETEKKIESGGIVIQSSLDGEAWITDTVLTDVFTKDSKIADSFYKTIDLQLSNGCFYRIIVAYKLEKKVGEKKIAFVKTSQYEEKKIAEVYKFYAINSEIAQDTISASDIPRKQLGNTTIKTKEGKGYKQEVEMDQDDPHWGWNLGSFVVNGYTREEDDNGTPIFLKNVGDRVVLWFTLEQDINALNGDSNLTIAEDKKGYDAAVKDIPRNNFKRGAVIIRFTNNENVTRNVLYTDFLAANAKTGADTRVQLFEEGDYEVILDYKIKADERKVGKISFLPGMNDYTMRYKYKIRNSNCIVFVFDLNTKNELSDKSITPNGFKLDMAKSKYLKMDVKKSSLEVDSNGYLKENTVFNRAAKDGDEFPDEGIYTISVKNEATGEETVKTFYVGDNKYLLALSKSQLTIDELNEKIKEGHVVNSDGTIK